MKILDHEKPHSSVGGRVGAQRRPDGPAGRPYLARWFCVALFAVAMAWVESAVVYYLRTMVSRIEPYQIHPLPLIGRLGPAEVVREAATLLMLLMVGFLAGQTWRSRLGYSAIAFGIWDIFYYVFLKVMCGWPHSLMDWDILFLLPLPWWGPVAAPLCIAFLMILWGTLVNTGQARLCSGGPGMRAWLLNFAGVALALYLFMSDAIGAAEQGVAGIREVLPTRFPWLPFIFALCLISAPVIEEILRLKGHDGFEHSALNNAQMKVKT